MNQFTKTTIAASLLAVSLGLTGCGVEESDDPQLPAEPPVPTIAVSAITVTNGGGEIVWDVSVHSEHKYLGVLIVPYNDASDSRMGLQLKCNAPLETNGQTRYCDDIEKIACVRTVVASRESRYDCSYEIEGIRYAPQFREVVMRTQTLDSSGDDLLFTVGVSYLNSAHNYDKIMSQDTSKMFNAYTSNVGP